MFADLSANVVEADRCDDVSDGIEDRTNTASGSPDVVEVFAVPPRACQPEFVEARATTEDKFVTQ